MGLSLVFGFVLFWFLHDLLLFSAESVFGFQHFLLFLLSVFFIRNTNALLFMFLLSTILIYINFSPADAVIALNLRGFTCTLVSPLVPIRYHNFFRFSIWNIVQTNENVLVENTDLRHWKSFSH